MIFVGITCTGCGRYRGIQQDAASGLSEADLVCKTCEVWTSTLWSNNPAQLVDYKEVSTESTGSTAPTTTTTVE